MGSTLAVGGERHYRSNELIVKLRSPASVGQSQQTSSQQAVTNMKSARTFYAKARVNHHLKTLGAWNGLNLHHMKLDETSNKSIEETIEELKQLDEVEFVEPNYILQAAFDNQRSQAYSIDQLSSVNASGVSAQGYSSGTAMTAAAIQSQPQVSASWPILAAGAAPVTVAVIDTGLDMNHSSFAHSIWTNTREVADNGIDDDGNGYVDDIHGWNFVSNNNNPQDDEGHGTHVAGIVLGVGFNIFSPPATTTNVQIMPLKFLDSSGSGVTTDAIKAIYYAANNGARVMNNSWGGGPYSQSLAEAIAYSYNKDVLFIAAAGNSGANIDASPSYPASYLIPNLVPVAASDDSDYKAGFSNYGAGSVSLSAPGVAILSTYPGNNFATMSGTSMAAPFVAGTAALMRYQSQSMNSYQLRNLLLQAVDKRSSLTPYVVTSGRLDVLNSVNLATVTAVDPYKPLFFLQANPGDRGLASSIAGRGLGCGLVGEFSREIAATTPLKQIVITFALLLMPLMFGVALRAKEKPVFRRKHQRYTMNSSVSLKLGDKELVGAVKTISMGGSEINTEALLEHGSIITMSISSPDGKSKIDVQGHVVWSEEQKRYGVAFDGIGDTVKQEIAQWSAKLPKAS